MPNVWTTDAEMVGVALMGEACEVSTAKGKAKEGQLPTWGKARLGQSILLLELILRLRGIRDEHGNQTSDLSITKALKFVVALETRLAILIDARVSKVLFFHGKVF